MNLTTEDYWKSVWAKSEPGDAFRGLADLGALDVISKHLPALNGASFLEIGSGAGHILAGFCAAMGYEAHGVDFATDPRETETLLRSRGVRVGQIHRADFLKWQPDRRYDIVGSFGFIEHFDDPDTVIRRHFELVEPDGWVIITMPNFARGQKLLHWIMDRRNLFRHNTRSMSLRFLRKQGKKNCAQMMDLRYTGGLVHFWYDPNERCWIPRQYIERITRFLNNFGREHPNRANRFFSPYIVAVYRAPSLRSSSCGGTGGL